MLIHAVTVYIHNFKTVIIQSSIYTVIGTLLYTNAESNQTTFFLFLDATIFDNRYTLQFAHIWYVKKTTTNLINQLLSPEFI